MGNVIIVVSIAIVAVIHLPSEDVSTTFTHISLCIYRIWQLPHDPGSDII